MGEPSAEAATPAPFNSYTGLALKQWSVYLGNVLLNFIHKECKNNNHQVMNNFVMVQIFNYF